MARRNYQSRLSRLEEKRTQKQLVVVILGIIIILFLVIKLGLPLMVKLSLLLGNLKTGTNITDTQDTTAPVAPTLFSIPTATNSAQLKIEGYAEGETTLKLYLNGDKVKEVLLDKEGTFLFTDINLEKGKNSLYATATDNAGNESPISQELFVTFSQEGPKLKINQPQDGQKFSRRDKEIDVNGTTDPGVSLSINSRFAAVNDEGSFSYKLTLNDGENKINVIAKDKAGNQTTKELTVTYSAD